MGLSLIGMLTVVYAVKEGAANGFRVDIAVAGAVGVLMLAVFVRRRLRLLTPLIDVRLFAANIEVVSSASSRYGLRRL